MTREVVALVFAVATITIWLTIREGRRLRQEEDMDFKDHTHLASRAMIMLAIALVVTELYVQTGGGQAIRWTPLFIVHLPCAAGSAILLVVLRFWMTGVRSPYHRRVAYTFCLLYAVTLVTGGFLLYGKH